MSATHPWLPWIMFTLFILLLLIIDLGVFHKEDHKISAKEAAVWSVVWISIGLLFGVGTWQVMGSQKGMEYFTGFLIEKSLSVDNIFVFIMIFSFFHVKPKYQHKILFYGILCAIVMRAGAIFAGTALLQQFHWLIYVFGGFLVVTGVKMMILSGKEQDPEENPILKFVVRRFRTVADYDTKQFFRKINGKLFVTPLFLALVAIEISDVIFAIDSVPAVLAITDDPFIVYTSNVFAILGLRSLYFISAELVRSLRYLTHGVAVVLLFVGSKMMASGYVKISSDVSLMIVGLILFFSVLISLLDKRKKKNDLLRED